LRSSRDAFSGTVVPAVVAISAIGISSVIDLWSPAYAGEAENRFTGLSEG
jgi:hypothetical protein